MNPYLLALAVPFLWSSVNYADKFLLSRYFKEKGIGTLLLYSSLFGIFAATGIAIFNPGVLDVSLSTMGILILVGFIQTAWIALYLLALDEGEASTIVPFFQLIPLFAYFFGVFFLGETFTTIKIIGGIIILLGTGVLSFEMNNDGKLEFKGKIALYMFISCFLAALIPTLFKLTSLEIGLWDAAFWRYVGFGLSGFILFALHRGYRRSFIESLRTDGFTVFCVNIGSESITWGADMIAGFVALTLPIFTTELLTNGTQPIFALFIGTALTLLFPHVAKENLKEHLAIKIVALVIIFIGFTIFTR